MSDDNDDDDEDGVSVISGFIMWCLRPSTRDEITSGAEVHPAVPVSCPEDLPEPIRTQEDLQRSPIAAGTIFSPSSWRLQMAPSQADAPSCKAAQGWVMVSGGRRWCLCASFPSPPQTPQYNSWDNYCDWVQMMQVSAGRMQGGGVGKNWSSGACWRK